MIVRNRLAVLMAEREIRSIADLQRKLIDDGYPVARRTLDRFHKNDNNRIDYDTIVALCSVLGCGVGDLFTLVKEETVKPGKTNE